MILQRKHASRCNALAVLKAAAFLLTQNARETDIMPVYQMSRMSYVSTKVIVDSELEDADLGNG